MTQHLELSTQHSAQPLPCVPITVRPGVMSDVPFLDSLQKLHTKQVGWMPTAQFEGKIAAGHVLVAEAAGSAEGPVLSAESNLPSLSTQHSGLSTRVGYVIGNDRYFKRDDVGIIYQMNVLPGRQRGLIGATLLKAMFERAAYGCRLFCCWCAQDIAANHFWEAMGFVPLAYRAGSETKGKGGSPRVHIFWQKRIRSGDATTPWWFPSKTSGGSIRADRIVLPIQPGTHWSEARPLLLPGLEGAVGAKPLPTVRKSRERKSAVVPAQKQSAISQGGLRFGPAVPAVPAKSEAIKAKREPKPKAKNDPRLVDAARELRDRWLEQINSTPLTGRAKYDVGRELPEPRRPDGSFPLLAEAA